MNIVDLVFPKSDGPLCDRRRATALIAGEETISYGELEAAVHQTADHLLAAGFPQRRPGRTPRIGLACPNSIEYVVIALAVLRNGGCLVPIAGELTPAEREELVRTVGVDALIISDKLPWPQVTLAPMGPMGSMATIAFPRHRVECWGVTLLPQLPDSLRPTTTPRFQENDLAAVNPAFIRFSSGTTGASKGVVLSHETLKARLESANRLLNVGPEDRILWILSMAHHFAVSIMLYLVRGATTIIAESSLATPLLEEALRHSATLLYGAPFHHALLAAEPSGNPWPTLRLAVSTAAPLPVETAHAFLRRYGIPLSQGLGMIEAGLPLLNLRSAREEPAAVGHLADCPEGGEGTEITIRNPDTGEPLPAGEPGELWLRTPGLFDAYLSPWRLREQVLTPDGWLRTGDLARLDPSGLITLVGRLKTVINVGGMKCFPEEIEAALQQHPGVCEVRVHGRAHPRFGTVPVAEIVANDPAPSAAQLITHARETLASYKIPVEFRFVPSLPRTASGKICRH